MHEDASHWCLAAGKFCCRQLTLPLRVALMVAAEPELPSSVLEQLLLRWNYDTLRWGDGVAPQIIAVGISHVPLPELLHGEPPLRGDDGIVRIRHVGFFAWAISREDLLDRVHRATVEDKIGIFGDKGGIFVIHLVSPTCSGPAWCIPYGGIDGHGLGRVVAVHGIIADHLPNWNTINGEAGEGEERVLINDITTNGSGCGDSDIEILQQLY